MRSRVSGPSGQGEALSGDLRPSQQRPRVIGPPDRAVNGPSAGRR